MKQQIEDFEENKKIFLDNKIMSSQKKDLIFCDIELVRSIKAILCNLKEDNNELDNLLIKREEQIKELVKIITKEDDDENQED